MIFIENKVINDVYQARYASDNTFARRRRRHRKLKIDSILWKFIVEAIRCLWSPQQIAKRLKTFPDLDQTMNVSHTTIYSTIRALPKGELNKDLLSCLRHENKKRKANGEPKKDSILQDIKTIHATGKGKVVLRGKAEIKGIIFISQNCPIRYM